MMPPLRNRDDLTRGMLAFVLVALTATPFGYGGETASLSIHSPQSPSFSETLAARVNCAWARFNQTIEQVEAQTDPATKKKLARVIVPTLRTSLDADEPLRLKVIIPTERPVREAALFWRSMGTGPFARVALTHVARSVHAVQLDPKQIERKDLEYYIEVRTDQADPIRFPPTAPEINQTVLVLPKAP